MQARGVGHESEERDTGNLTTKFCKRLLNIVNRARVTAGVTSKDKKVTQPRPISSSVPAWVTHTKRTVPSHWQKLYSNVRHIYIQFS